jgi:hypothetical protein
MPSVAATTVKTASVEATSVKSSTKIVGDVMAAKVPMVVVSTNHEIPVVAKIPRPSSDITVIAIIP